MDFDSLYYFAELAKDLNMTKTAARLYISQQTLSNHIQRLEQYYHVRLLERKPTLSLTCAGEMVLKFALDTGREQQNLRDQLSEVAHEERGDPRVGASTLRGSQLLPRILPDFYQRYPKVEVRFSDGLSQKLERKIRDGELDLAVVLSGNSSPDLVDREFLQDQVYLCIPEDLLRQHYSPGEIVEIKSRSLQGADPRDFARLPFSVLTNRLGGRISRVFSQMGFEPQICFSGTYTSQTLPLCTMGVAACYCTHTSLVEHYSAITRGINIFPLLDGGEPIVQKLSITYHKQRYLTCYVEYFMDLLTELTQRVERVPVSRVVQE